MSDRLFSSLNLTIRRSGVLPQPSIEKTLSTDRMTIHNRGNDIDVVRRPSLTGAVWLGIAGLPIHPRFFTPTRSPLALMLFVAVWALIGTLSLSQETFAQSRGLSSPGGDSFFGDEPVEPRRSLRSKSQDSNSKLKTKISQTSLDDSDMMPSLPKEAEVLDEPLAEVLIEGNTTILESEIAKHIHVRPGRSATQRQIKEDVDTLMRTRWFFNVQTSIRQSEEGPILIFKVIERPIVRRVEYKGLKKVKQKVFDSLTQLKPGSPFDVSANRECRRRIEEYYKEKGFFWATVELEKGDHPDDREVVFLIEEGKKVHVTAVKFDGNKQFYDGILKTKTRTKTQILWLFGGKYDPSTIRDDMDAVRQYYHSLGYFDVEITPKERFSEDKSKLEIHYHVEEGVRYTIRKIELDGNQVMTEEQLRGMMKVAEGIHYNARDIAKDVDVIRTKYGEQGRLKCQVNVVPRFIEEPGILDLIYRIEEDKVYRIREIRVHIAGDHPHTKRSLVQNVSPVHPGDLADPKKIGMIKRRLEGSGYFEGAQDGNGGVRVEAKPVDGGDSWVAKPDYSSSARGQSAGKFKFPPSKPADDKTKKPLVEPKQDLRSQFSVPSEFSPSMFGLRNWVGTKASKEESRDPSRTVTGHFASATQLAFDPRKEEQPVVDDKLSPITPIFRAQSMDPLRPPASFGFEPGPPGDPFGKAPTNEEWQYDPLNPPEFTDIDVTVSEARTGRLMFGVGVNSNAGLVGNIVLSEQNFNIMRPPTSWDDIANGRAFRGAGQKFRIEAQPGTQVSRYLVDWSDPYFMDSNYNVGVSGFYFLRYYRNWSEQRMGGRLRVGQQLTTHWSGSLALRLEDVNLFNPTLPSPPDLANAVGTSFLSTVRASLIHDTRDAAFNTGEGHYVELSYEQGFGQFNYPRFEVEGRQFFTTYQRVDGQGRHTVSLRGHVGWSGNDTPIYERFFAGGFQNFRGFAFRGVSPVEGIVYVGGDFMALGTVEYQLPVTANEMVKLVAFSDFGTVNANASLDNFRLSVGAGARITIPMMGPVPIALDFGVPLMQEQTDIKQVFSFYVGAQY